MAEREERKEQAKKHLSLVNGALADNTQATVEAAVIYKDGEGCTLDLPDSPFEETETMVTGAFAPEALRFARGKTAIVDPASFTRPGGGYEDGSFGPEQVICSESNLYPVLQGMKSKFHDANRGYSRGMLFTDRAMYLPDVAFLQGGTMNKANIIAVAEPRKARALENHRPEPEVEKAIVDRIETILRIAAANGNETLICNAFGCGREGYDPETVAAIFRKWIDEHPGAVGKIVFSVPRAYREAFDEAFGKPVEPVKPEMDEEEEEELEEWRTIDLPEGITIR